MIKHEAFSSLDMSAPEVRRHVSLLLQIIAIDGVHKSVKTLETIVLQFHLHAAIINQLLNNQILDGINQFYASSLPDALVHFYN